MKVAKFVPKYKWFDEDTAQQASFTGCGNDDDDRNNGDNNYAGADYSDDFTVI